MAVKLTDKERILIQVSSGVKRAVYDHYPLDDNEEIHSSSYGKDSMEIVVKNKEGDRRFLISIKEINPLSKK